MEELYIGEIILLPYTFEPMDMALCDGRQLQIMQYQALYSLLGVKFGGNGSTYFNLPNLKGSEPIPGTAYYMALTGIYPIRP